MGNLPQVTEYGGGHWDLKKITYFELQTDKKLQ